MNLLKRWRKQQHDINKDNGGGRNEHAADHGLAKRAQGTDTGGTLLDRVRGEMDHVFDRIWGDLAGDPWSALNSFDMPAFKPWPAVDVAEDERAVTLRADVPGIDEKDLDVEVAGNVLTIRGSRDEEHEDKSRRRHERVTGRFVRTVTLPSYVDPAGVEARYEKGVLTVTVPKVPGRGPKRVKVNA